MTRLLRGATSSRSAEPAAEARGDGTAEAAKETANEDALEASTDAETRTGTRTGTGTGAAAEAESSSAAEDAEVPDDGDAEVSDDGDGEVSGGDAARAFPATWQKAALAAVVAVLLLAGSAFFYGAHQLRSTPSARNHALTDAGATARVGGDVAEGLARIFSYTPASDDAVERSAGTVLAGRAARQYADLFAQVRAKLVEQRITLSTQTVRTGVIELDGDSARLLVFLDQTSRRDIPRGDSTRQDKARQDKATATSAAAQLTVTATFQGDRWLIVDIKAR
ncbi:Mce-associated membrane protein [Streptomyces sp. PvR006]|uniref:hypothetical protein n=1 Tax=Streptomyces sp. PvR006 TaxID=2817860 RepID=UPI001FD9AEAE|nr:hypothetical protein [Streptomyces sp. PvR006]MBP2580606.1 Mce-associated membrane protein [Streptomyces sp. PvR006]